MSPTEKQLADWLRVQIAIMDVMVKQSDAENMQAHSYGFANRKSAYEDCLKKLESLCEGTD